MIHLATLCVVVPLMFSLIASILASAWFLLPTTFLFCLAIIVERECRKDEVVG